MISITQYEEADRDEVIELVLRSQNDGSRPIVGIADQPELLCIKEKYFAPGGCFWVAKDEGRVVGSIGLMNCGNGTGILKKFFVHADYQGAPLHLGRKLYAVLLSFAKQRRMEKIVLDTPKNTERAHRFYRKAGFQRIEKDELPVVYDYPYKDSDFFMLTIDYAVPEAPE